jgi:hypothetical protein
MNHEESPVWKTEDPRFTVDKRAGIVILRPAWRVGLGTVDTKEGWVIHTTFEDRPTIGVDDEWELGWKWAFAPGV